MVKVATKSRVIFKANDHERQCKIEYSSSKSSVLLTLILSFQKVNSKVNCFTIPDWLVIELAESSSIGPSCRIHDCQTDTLAALAADVETARMLCAPYLFMSIPAFSKTFF